ncbi:MAG: ferritin-like domain-containing protein [Spirulinaceae cyanobacterium SM2_1_0]|nr:ferritin-like domain-containing protein [Spirulinaceae cyanobacterium SM2_1_0]
MNPLTNVLQIVGSGAIAYMMAVMLRDSKTRPTLLAGLQLAESGSVPMLESLRDRAVREDDTWLAERLERHASDERRHGYLFARALQRLGKQVVPLAERQRSRPETGQPDPFFGSYYEGYSREDLQPECIDWLVFAASTHILELDASKDFARLARVLPEQEARDRQLSQALLSIARDEERHAAYLLEALHRRLPRREVAWLVDDWRERKVRAMLAMAGSFFQQGDRRLTLVRDGVPTEAGEVEVEELALA